MTVMKKGEQFLYGRARRIELAKKVIGIALIVLIILTKKKIASHSN